MFIQRAQIHHVKNFEYRKQQQMAVNEKNVLFSEKIFKKTGFKISDTGLKSISEETDSIKKLPNPKNFSELRSIFG